MVGGGVGDRVGVSGSRTGRVGVSGSRNGKARVCGSGIDSGNDGSDGT